MPVTPPLNLIPLIPSKGVGVITKSVNTQLQSLVDQVSNLSNIVNKLPEQANPNSPATKLAVNQAQNVIQQLKNVENTTKNIPTVVNLLTSLVSSAQALKAIQLLNPVTAPAVIASELIVVQNMTIANSIQALEQLSEISSTIKDTLGGISSQLNDALTAINNANNVDSEIFSVPEEATIQNSDIPSEFYNSYNVSEEDLSNRLENIQTLIDQQQDLLSSLEEAPSKVFDGPNPPDANQGKPGDYFIDTKNRKIYGPKLIRSAWPEGINY